jgi:hypothetical protein
LAIVNGAFDEWPKRATKRRFRGTFGAAVEHEVFSGEGVPSVIERSNHECMHVSSCRPQGQPVVWLLRWPVSGCSSPQRAKGHALDRPKSRAYGE